VAASHICVWTGWVRYIDGRTHRQTSSNRVLTCSFVKDILEKAMLVALC
jgi:hypothetical protein